MLPLRIHLILALATLALVACGGSDKSTTSSQNTDDGSVQLYGAKVATTAATLPTCDSTQVGQLFYVLANQGFQFCSSEGYQSIDLTGAAGADGADGKDGANGTNGTKGSDGADGSSCSVISNASGSKTIACADGTTATVSDGKSCTVVDNGDGSYDLICSGTTVTVRDGKDGENGTGCTVTDDHAGTLTQTCMDGTSVSWSKALCGTQTYEPATHFCEAGNVLELCGGDSYATATHFCEAGNILELCGGDSYATATHFCDNRDSRLYKKVTIGIQTWMAENLAYLPSVNLKTESSPSEARYYVYNYDGNVVADAKANVVNDTNYYTTYGVLYNWPAAMAGVCPTGWHLPSDAEWTTLETYVGEASTAGTQLKSVSGWEAVGVTGTDTYGFSALPGGTYSQSGFTDALNRGFWWTTSDNDATDACVRIMIYNNTGVISRSNLFTYYGLSVRCVKD